MTRFISDRLSNTEVQVVGDHLEQLQQAGPLTAEVVLADSRRLDSPLRKYFADLDDDTHAAWVARLERARWLIRTVHAVYETVSGSVETRAFVITGSQEQRSYTPIVAALANEQMRCQVIARARKQLLYWSHELRAYGLLTTSQKIDEALEDLRASVAG